MIDSLEIKKNLDANTRYWIAFVGDSITSCEWVHPNWREMVEYVLKQKFGESWELKTFNFGYDGATTSDIVKKIPEIKKVDPDLVLLMIGANDPFLNVSIDEHIENIHHISKEFGSRLIFSTCNKPWNEISSEKYKPYVESDSHQGFDNFINLFEISDTFPKEKIYTFLSEENPVENIKAGDVDYWHPNQLGNAYIAQVILKSVFGIDFDPELYWKSTLEGEKCPRY